jgi:murein DD-endopeptidase MepM/ murein hydrolase activator NlpD
MRWLAGLLLVAILALGAAFWWAGRAAGPQIEIRQPTASVGQATPLDVGIVAPDGKLSSLEIAIEQNGARQVVATLEQGAPQPDANGQISINKTIGRAAWPELKSGAARIVVRAARPVMYGLRQAASEATRDVQVRLEPPRVEVLSTFHYINQGGAEFVVYRATPADVESGVRVGDQTYPGMPGAAAGLKGEATRVAFFALLHDQDPNAPVTVFAKDLAGNEATVALDRRVFPKPFARSRIEITDKFLQQVVPAIAATTPDMQLSTAPNDLVASFVRINRDLRARNNQTLVELSRKTAKEMLWKDAFQPLSNAQVEAKFADSRTYVHQEKDIDHQVHLGFDLAVTAHIPVVAANRGVVLHASDLGIFGNCVVIDHGLGVQSLYGHLSSIDVKVGDTIEKGQTMGRSGMTGLAAGDHLHFTMLVHGRAVNPVEWWDPKWMQDRVLRKISEAQ